MNTTLIILNLCPFILLTAWAERATGQAPTLKFTVGKATTFVTEPLDENGYVDYAGALNERLRQGVTPRNNANVLIWQALGPRPEGGRRMPPAFFTWLGIDEPPERGDYFIDLTPYARHHLRIEPGDQLEAVWQEQRRTAQRPWSANQHPHIAAWLKDNEKPLALVVAATRRPRYFSPVTPPMGKHGSKGLLNVLLPGVQKCRSLTTALAARAMLHVGEGRPDAVWQDLLACHRLARHVGSGVSFVEALVGFALDSIAANADVAFLESAALTARQLQACRRDLQQLPPFAPLGDKLDGYERFLCLEAILQIDQKDGSVDLELGAAEIQALREVDWDPILRKANSWHDRMATALRIKHRTAREKELAALAGQADQAFSKSRPTALQLLFRDKQTLGKRIGDILVGMFLPSLRKMAHAADRAEQVQRNLLVAFALAEYRVEERKYPKQLADLAPKYLAEVPGDLFSGNELIYRLSDNGYLLYSVGVNGKDDGGRWLADDPPGDDPCIRLPLPAWKRAS